jgi:tetratricopeptide (TPR) repeat protein
MYQWFARDQKSRDKAQELSFKALMYDGNLAEAYTAMGLSYFIWGRLEEANASASKAIELAPDDFIAHWTLGRIQFSLGKHEEAAVLFKRVIALKPAFYSAYVDIAQACEQLGRMDEVNAARDELRSRLPVYLLQNPDDARARIILAVMLVEGGDREGALAEGTKALELSPNDPMMIYNCACLYARLGEPQRALEALNQAVAGGYKTFGWMEQDPDLASLRTLPEFQKIVATQRLALTT